MTVYVIQGETGAYEEFYTWISGIYTNKHLAESTMNQYQAYASSLPEYRTTSLSEVKEAKQNSPDPLFDWDYRPTTYTLKEFNLITDKFMETLLTLKD